MNRVNRGGRNYDNYRTASAKTINLGCDRKLIQYYLQKSMEKMQFFCTVFEILLSQGRSVLSPVQQVAGSERVKVFSILHFFLY